ncbi:MAG: hypothetical protein HOO67_04995 [Candidatus Peribacteraceae bacterium]|nr:hypothetical protein [Candidatus Peribacteraceae bacterium]
MKSVFLALMLVASFLLPQDAKLPSLREDSDPSSLDHTIPPLFTNINGVTNFLLAYSGLTWDHLKDVIRSEIGAGNYAAIERIAGITASLEANPVDMLSFLSNLPARFGSDLNSLVSGFWDQLQADLMGAAKRQILSMLAQIAPRILAKFDPTAGLIVSIYDGVNFVLGCANPFWH